jgi:hypothetical protein
MCSRSRVVILRWILILGTAEEELTVRVQLDANVLIVIDDFPQLVERETTFPPQVQSTSILTCETLRPACKSKDNNLPQILAISSTK